MGQATHEQVKLMLRLYELRREPRLRQARDWMIRQFTAKTPEEFQKQCPPGSDPHTSFRMAISYWDMVAGIANRELLDEELFFETKGAEQFLVWERLKPSVPGWRAMFKNPYVMSNLEEHCKRLEAFWEKRAPGWGETMRENLRRMAMPPKKAGGKRKKK